MKDSAEFLRAVSAYSRILLIRYDVVLVLQELASRLVDTLDLVGCGVALESEQRLQPVSAFPSSITRLENIQLQTGRGPGVVAFGALEVVAVADIRTEAERWPTYCAAAERVGVGAVAGIPMRFNGGAIGVFTLY